MAEIAFIRLAEVVGRKQNMRVVSVTVKPTIADCSGTIYFTDLMLQEGPALTGYTPHTEPFLQSCVWTARSSLLSGSTAWCGARKRSSSLTLGRLPLGWMCICTPSPTWKRGQFPSARAWAARRYPSPTPSPPKRTLLCLPAHGSVRRTAARRKRGLLPVQRRLGFQA